MLHFNLKLIFSYCLLVGIWNLLFPFTLAFSSILLGGLCAYYGYKYKANSAEDFIFSAALLLNIWYLIETTGVTRQYDYYNFYMHADYYIQNDFFLTQPKQYFSIVFYQPPLWGAIVALITKCGMFLGVGQEQAFDTVKWLNLFFISGTFVLFEKLLHQFKLKYKKILFSLFCFFPAHGIMANLVNNDSATYFFMMAIIYCGYSWYCTQKLKKAVEIAFLLFGVGLIKFSGLMVVPALGSFGVLMLLKFKNKFSAKLWTQFMIIGLGAVFGFAWGWFLLYYHFPLVPPPMDNPVQNMENYSIIERLFSLERASIPFAEIANGKIEPNVFLALIKTAMFGEWSWHSLFWAYLLYGCGLVLFVCFIFSGYTFTCYKVGNDWGFNLFALVLVYSVLISWCGFWLEYPFFSSTEFRYVTILLPFGLIGLGNYLNQKILPKTCEIVLAGGTILMIVARFMLYLNTI